MHAWIKTVITILLAIFLALGSWGLSQASKNAERITALQAKIVNSQIEYKVLLSSLIRIEKGIMEINTKQETFNIKMGKMNVAQAIANQKTIDHINFENQRIGKIQDRLNKHLHK